MQGIIRKKKYSIHLTWLFIIILFVSVNKLQKSTNSQNVNKYNFSRVRSYVKISFNENCHKKLE